MPPYSWVWSWNAKITKKEYQSLPSDEEIDSYMRQKVAEELVKQFVAKGFSLNVISIATTVTTSKLACWGKDIESCEYLVNGTTTTTFNTNAKVFGSPILPAVVLAIASVISAISSLLLVVFYFYAFTTVVNLIKDIGTGIGEDLGITTGSGIAIIVIALVSLGLIGLFLWSRR